MPTYSALTTLTGKDAAEKLGRALEELDPEPTGVGVLVPTSLTLLNS